MILIVQAFKSNWDQTTKLVQARHLSECFGMLLFFRNAFIKDRVKIFIHNFEDVRLSLSRRGGCGDPHSQG